MIISFPFSSSRIQVERITVKSFCLVLSVESGGGGVVHSHSFLHKA